LEGAVVEHAQTGALATGNRQFDTFLFPVFEQPEQNINFLSTFDLWRFPPSFD
jgi:hypothetical protein